MATEEVLIFSTIIEIDHGLLTQIGEVEEILTIFRTDFLTQITEVIPLLIAIVVIIREHLTNIKILGMPCIQIM